MNFILISKMNNSTPLNTKLFKTKFPKNIYNTTLKNEH